MYSDTPWDPDGSSPLARGTRSRGALDRSPHRFIPARAGNTFMRSGPVSGLAVHPRSRGEHGTTRPPKPSRSGSSPLARGTQVDPRGQGLGVRFIPARAGNTRASPVTARLRPVHPRSRGEHAVISPRAARISGSSPLARGTRGRAGGRGRSRRFIPARAGNTTDRRATATGTTVHPRSRGEHRRRFEGIQLVTGSSPLARGTLAQAFHHVLAQRFIPARAGNT